MTETVTFISPEAEADVILLRSDKMGRLKFGAVMILLALMTISLVYGVNLISQMVW